MRGRRRCASGAPGTRETLARLCGEHADFRRRLDELVEGFAHPGKGHGRQRLADLRSLMGDLRRHDVEEQQVLRQTVGR